MRVCFALTRSYSLAQLVHGSGALASVHAFVLCVPVGICCLFAVYACSRAYICMYICMMQVHIAHNLYCYKCRVSVFGCVGNLTRSAWRSCTALCSDTVVDIVDIVDASINYPDVPAPPPPPHDVRKSSPRRTHIGHALGRCGALALNFQIQSMQIIIGEMRGSGGSEQQQQMARSLDTGPNAFYQRAHIHSYIHIY